MTNFHPLVSTMTRFFHVAQARIADHLGERGCHISTFGDCVIDPSTMSSSGPVADVACTGLRH